jgi:energy-coupling factor transporter transmembrane protein EcfT
VKFVRTTPSLNGKYEALPQRSGASVIPPQRTTFPEDHPRFSIRTFLYAASHYRMGNASPLRWLLLLLVGIGAFAVVGRWPGRWWIVSFALLLLLALLVLFHSWRRRDFVRFVPGTPPARPAQLLPPQEKAPVLVTGLFSVEHKYKRFTWLPGFYRTFATREHALLCQIAHRSWAALGRWPEDELGLWYIFFVPRDILHLQWGELFFGADARPAIAVTHRVLLPKQKRFGAEQVRDETIYLAFATVVTGEVIWADLQHDFPANAPSPR